jgi:hypothetical protein
MVSVAGAAVKRAATEFVFEAVAGSVDGEDFAVVEQPVQDGRGNDVVTKPVMMPVSSKASYAACEPVEIGDE